MKVKMLRDAKGSEDGFSVKAYLSGQEYEVSDVLAAALVDDMKAAERTGVAGVADKVADAVDAVVGATKGKAKKVDDPPKD
jgi:hypothetical protein